MAENGNGSGSNGDYVDADEGFTSSDYGFGESTIEDEQLAHGEPEPGGSTDLKLVCDSTSFHGATSHSLRRRVLKSLGQTSNPANSVERSINLIESSSEITECNTCEGGPQDSDGNRRSRTNKFVVKSQDLRPGGYEPDIDEEDGNRTEHSKGRTIPGNRLVTGRQSRRTDVDASASFEELEKSYLFWIAGLVIQAIGFQLGILWRMVSFPAWLLHQGYYVVTEPARIVSMAKQSVKEYLVWVCSPVSQGISTVLKGSAQAHPYIGKVARKFGWGCFWSSYVCFVLCLLLVVAFSLDYLAMLQYVEKPIRMREHLHFDYTKPRPVAVVPRRSCYRIAGLEDNGTKDMHEKSAGPRLFPANHKLQVTVVLTLPESDYNRKLGMFQIRTEALSTSGKVMAASSYPCMLRFKSLPIRYAETFLMSAPLLMGYSTESQILNLPMMEFTENVIPTACLRVILEHRAEFLAGAGIPEIYNAELFVDSELPWLKKIIWNWKWTIFIWLGMGFYAMELLLLLCCCRPVILPNAQSKERVRDEPNGNQNPNS